MTLSEVLYLLGFWAMILGMKYNHEVPTGEYRNAMLGLWKKKIIQIYYLKMKKYINIKLNDYY